MITEFTGPRSSLLQIRLREEVYLMIGDQPGMDIHEIYEAITVDCAITQLRAAMDWLRDNKCIQHEGDSNKSRYFQVADEIMRRRVPAHSTPLPKCSVMPSMAMHPMQWCLFMLGAA